VGVVVAAHAKNIAARNRQRRLQLDGIDVDGAALQGGLRGGAAGFYERQRACARLLGRQVKRRDAPAVTRNEADVPPALVLESRDAQILSPVAGLKAF
jgi:hypothetical protein